MSTPTYDEAGVTYDDLDLLYTGWVSQLSDPANYRVQVFAFADSTSFGVGALVADFELAKYVGWGDYLNDVPEAFFTINQEDPKVQSVLSYIGRAHVRIWRNDEVVFAGWLIDSDETKDDVIFYCYGYMAGLFWALTGWNQTWTSAQIHEIVIDLYAAASTGLTKSLLTWIPKGQIETIPTTRNGVTPLVLPSFKGFLSIVLFQLRELAGFSESNTGAATVFEITHGKSPQFNFLKDKGQDRPNTMLVYPKNISTFRRRRSFIFRRNDLQAVGSAPHDVAMRKSATDAVDYDTWGHRQGAAYFSWVRDEDELTRATNRRFARAKRSDVSLQVGMKPNSLVPPGAAGAQFELADRLPVWISKGLTQIDGTYFQVVGHQTIAMRGVEVVHLMLQEPLA